MDSGFVRTVIVLVIFSVQGFDSISGLTLCDNTKKTRSSNPMSFPRSEMCNDLPNCKGKICSFAKLSCPSNYSIYNPEILGLHSSEMGTCTGQTIHLMIDTSKCYWTDKCTIKYPEVPVIVKHLDGEADCRGNCIHAVYVRGWQCIRNTMIHKMCDNSKSFVIGQTADGGQGVVRSHEEWPFLYDEDDVIPAGDTECNKTFHPHLSGVHGGYTRLALAVAFLEIRPEYEILRAVSDDKVVEFNNTDEPAVHVFPQGKKVVLSLKKVGLVYKRKKQLGGDGFVICFRFLKKGESSSVAHVCSALKPNRKDAKCVNCKYRKRGKLFRNYCGGDMQGGRVYNVTLTNRKKQLNDGCRPWTMVDKPCKKKKPPGNSGTKGKGKRTRIKKKKRGKGKKRGGPRG